MIFPSEQVGSICHFRIESEDIITMKESDIKPTSITNSAKEIDLKNLADIECNKKKYHTYFHKDEYGYTIWCGSINDEPRKEWWLDPPDLEPA